MSLLAAASYPYVIGDFGQVLEVQLLLNNAACDLTGFTAITLRLRSPAGNEQSLACVLMGSDSTLGKVGYAWTGAEIMSPGIYLAEWVVTWADEELTFPRNGQALQIVARRRI